ncbi:MAG: hypothetical protein JWM27_4563 [Gemmatimonadetes bacterium]|nr:hypothetical protein [Gemmatimonadota bacterium]
MGRKVREYRSDGIAVTFDARLCIHAERCVHGLPRVFDPAARPWIRPEMGDPDAVAQVVARCPTGALQYTRLDGGAAEAPEPEAIITVSADGALYVRGDVAVVDEDGGVFARGRRMALCRCGQSSNRPFCDGAHARIGFTG